MLRRKINSNEREDVEINLSPMIDMVFILLIFFIVTTVFVEETGVQVNKPEAAASVQLEKNSILIAITKQNKVIYGGRDIGISGVAPIVKRLLVNEDLPVIIQGDIVSNHEIFAKVYGEAKLAGAKKLSFSTPTR
jgi:biopolymer transport protein ExbD